MVNTNLGAKVVLQGVDAADSTSSTARHDNEARKVLLSYIFDPLCGWCYAAAPLIHAAAKLPNLSVQLHAGGMMSGANRQTVSPALRNYVMPHDQRIAQLTGQPFGEDYFNGLLLDTNAIFDSTPPTLAILAAAALGHDPLAMLGRIQTAHYAEGQRIADGTVLLALATELGIESAAFAAAMNEQASQVDAHFAKTRAVMQQEGLRGFPSLLLEIEGQRQHIDIGPFLGKPAEFVAWLELAAVAEASEEQVRAVFCTPESCA
ncbi:DsbA family protein [Chitinibacter bivalviorum]|uniref:DsbA family protein n=1 Tax=Chitinibacter bivalviorum TaxID=2739434 RepID=A0A7H9BLB1_9NEIS|nr:DsbA family protein [Chitinibacter bivalviorum]QLG89058.1 DsbA family protein [Chitinibacter bivalviorum]